MIYVFLALFTFSAIACEGKKIMAEVGTLKACAENEKGIVQDLLITANGKTLFEGDTAFKAYKVAKTKDSIEVDESLSLVKGFFPYARITAKCEGENCTVKDTKCLWKKTKIDDKKLNEVINAQKMKLAISDTQWTLAFEAALNGHKEAIELFKGQIGNASNASGKETFETHKQDVERLLYYKCI